MNTTLRNNFQQYNAIKFNNISQNPNLSNIKPNAQFDIIDTFKLNIKPSAIMLSFKGSIFPSSVPLKILNKKTKILKTMFFEFKNSFANEAIVLNNEAQVGNIKWAFYKEFDEMRIIELNSKLKSSHKGIGKALVQSAIEAGLEKKFKRIKLSAINNMMPEDSPILFYRRLGFKVDKNYYIPEKGEALAIKYAQEIEQDIDKLSNTQGNLRSKYFEFHKKHGSIPMVLDLTKLSPSWKEQITKSPITIKNPSKLINFCGTKRHIKLMEKHTGNILDALIEKTYVSVNKNKRHSIQIKKDGKSFGIINYTKQEDHLKIEDLMSLKINEIKDIGTVLMQSVVEESIKQGFKGKLKVLAQNFDFEGFSPFPFYMKKCGLTLDRTKTAKPNTLAAQLKYEFELMEKEGRKFTKKFNYLDLELTPANAKKWWAKKIKENPIFI